MNVFDLLSPVWSILSLDTCVCIEYICLPLFSISHWCYHLCIIILFIIALISYLLYDTVISILVSITACFASLSAASLPFTPTRAGTHMNITVNQWWSKYTDQVLE